MQSACTLIEDRPVLVCVWVFCVCMWFSVVSVCFYLYVCACVRACIVCVCCFSASLFSSVCVYGLVCTCFIQTSKSTADDFALQSSPSPPSVQTNPDGSARPETCQVITHVSDGNQYAPRVYTTKNPFSISFMQFLKLVLIFKGFRGAF